MHSASAPVTPIVRRISHASPATSRCITPTWYSTLISDAKKMMIGSTRNANTKPHGPEGLLRFGPNRNAIPASDCAISRSTSHAAC
jgi:hypothetical protein